MSDRIAVFNRGRVEQVGTPADVYERPSTSFVAGFVGTSNLLEGSVASSLLGVEGTFTIRPEKIRVLSTTEIRETQGAHDVRAPGIVQHVEYLGPYTRFRVALDAGAVLQVMVQNTGDGLARGPGERVVLAFERRYIFDIQ